MNVNALRHAGLAGLANRGVQAVSRVLDRAAVSVGRPRYGHLAPSPYAGRATGPEPARFFAGACDDHAVAAMRTRLPAAVDAVVAAADAALAGRFDLLGYRELDFGRPLDWHADPVAGRRAPWRHWSLIDPLAYDDLGDHKVIWELNRHQWWVELGQAWRLTRDRRYPDAFAGHLADWMDANPPGMGINWASSLEVAYRLASWCWALCLFRGAPQVDDALDARVQSWVRAHALHVERYLSYYYSPNTHLTGEALGLLYAGATFPGLDEAPRWRKLGAHILAGQVERQVHPDGVYFEQATCYQRYTAEIYLHYLALAARNGMPVPDEVVARVHALLDAMLWLRGPEGSLPRIGDDDGGALLRVPGRGPGDVCGVFAVAAAMFGRPDYAWAAGGLQPEAFWLLGQQGVRNFDAVRPAPPASSPSRAFDRGGYAVMRSDWKSDAHRMIVDTGPLGCPVSSGHGHADLLSIQCHAFGRPVIVDPGTGNYTPDGGWRDRFRGTASHSTATVDGAGQAEPAGPFRWHERCGARLRAWHSDARSDLVDADHDAYGRLADPVRHRRRVLFVKPRYWVVVDDFAGAARHRVAMRFQFAPGIAVEAGIADRWTTATLDAGHHLLLRSFSRCAGDLAVTGGWVSPAYGQRVRAPALDLVWEERLPLRVVTLLVPLGPGDGPPLRAWRRDGDRFHFAMQDGVVVVDDDRIALEDV